MSFCSSCGHEIQQGTIKFCPQCGIQLPRDGAPQAAPASIVPPLPAPSIKPETSGMAIGSLICGIFFFFFPSAAAAVVLGHLSQSDIRRSGGRKTGAGLALAGLVLGYFGLTSLIIIVLIAIPNLLRAKLVANGASAAVTLHTLNASALMYSNSYGGFPHALSDLGPPAGTSTPASSAADLIDALTAGGAKNGYTFAYVPVSTDHSGFVTGYSITASPVTPGTTGTRYFFTDQSDMIRAEENRPATAESPPYR
jgi:type IV pilus assembly protein PilA